MNKFASPTKDSTFKLMFGEERHENITIDFLNSFLDRKPGNLINKISFMKQEQTPRYHVERKSILDIHCKDEAGNQFIIEMQAGRENHFIARALYYAASLLSRQLDRKDLFTDLKQVIVIAILDYTLLDAHKQAISHHLITDMSSGKQSTNLIELHFIELTKFKKTENQLESQTDKWIFFLKNAHKLVEIPESCRDSKVITQAFHLMEYNNWNKEQRGQYESDLLNFKKDLTHDHELLKEGEQKGLQKGRQEGEYKKAVETAMNFLKIGLTPEVIAQGTGLSIEEIEILRKKIK